MNHCIPPAHRQRRHDGHRRLLLLALALGLAQGPTLAVWSQSLSPNRAPLVAGGMPAVPIITSVAVQTQRLTIHWTGTAAPYWIYGTAGIGDRPWEPVAGPLQALSWSLPAPTNHAFFRVAGRSPEFAGASACVSCHEDAHLHWAGTTHAQALQTLKKIRAETNRLCLPCHTVGYGLPTGFATALATPQLAGVQCENCHGPAGEHVNYPDDPVLRPSISLAAVCPGVNSPQATLPRIAWVINCFFSWGVGTSPKVASKEGKSSSRIRASNAG